jgi:F-type H+-transporting ATPase subunit delta
MNENLNRRYALALYNVGEEKNNIEEYLSDISAIVDILDTDTNLQRIVNKPEFSTTQKIELFTNIFKNKVDDDVLSFILLLLEKKRILNLKDILSSMKEIQLEKNNTQIAKVKTVIPLNDEERDILREKLSVKYKMNIILEEEIDKEILGGVFVRVGDDVIDDTLRHRILEMKKLMLERE